jgi:hypothetical protein
MSFIQVSASDQDLGGNRDVEYTIVADDSGTASASRYFSIGTRNGIILTNASLTSVGKMPLRVIAFFLSSLLFLWSVVSGLS